MTSEPGPMNDRHENEELERIAPTLSAREPRDPFVVPEGFFDRFPHEVQAAIAARARRRGWAGLPVPVRRLAFALPLIALLVGTWWYFNTEGDSTPIAELSTTPSLEELSWSDQEYLLASLEEEGFATAAFTDVELTEAELAAYLMHENVDITELITEP